MEVMDSLRAALKELILPELDRIKQENAQINAKVEPTNIPLEGVVRRNEHSKIEERAAAIERDVNEPKRQTAA